MTTHNGQSEESGSSDNVAEGGLPGHREFQQVHNYSTMRVLAIDASCSITYANPALLNYFALPNKEVISHYIFDFFTDVAEEQTNKNKLLKREDFANQEFTINAKPGQQKCALISTKVYGDKNGVIATYLFIRDITVLKKKERLLAYLNKAAEELAKSRDTKSALNQISQAIVPTFANWFSIDLLKNNQIELLLLKHEDPDKIQWAMEYRKNYPTNMDSDSGSARVLKTGIPTFVPVITEQMITAAVTNPVQLRAIREIGLQSVITVAMSNKEQITGAITFVSSTPDRHYDEADLEFAQNFANLIGLSLENARLNEEAANELARRKQSEEQFRFLLDSIPHKMWTTGPDGKATYYNKGWYDYSGIDNFETLREKIWDMIHPVDRELAAVQWPIAVRTGESMDMEHRFMRHDGEYRWHLSRFSAHKDEEGRIILWIGTSTDIHEQKQSQQNLAGMLNDLTKSEQKLDQIINELPAHVVVINGPDQVIEKINDYALAFWDKPKHEVIGRPLLKILPELEGQPFPDQLKHVLETGETIAVKESLVVLQSPDGGTKNTYVDYSYQPLTGNDGVRTGVLVMSFDVTDKVESRGLLEKYTKELQAINNEVAATNEELLAANEELAAVNEELAAVNEEMVTTNEELAESEKILQHTINELVVAKGRVETSERLFRSIAINIPKSLVMVIGADSRFLMIEGDLMGKLGYGSGDYTGKHPAEVTPPERYAATKHLYERVLSGEQFTQERKNAAGDDFRVEFVPLRNEKGEVYAALMIALDITELKQAEEKSAKLAAIVESSDDAIIGKTPDGIVTSWNKAAERIFGYTAAEMIGQPIMKLIPEDKHYEQSDILLQLKTGRRIEHFETKRVTKDNNILDVSLTISPIRDSQGNITGLSKIARDITEQKKDELRKSDFIGMVSHELKTPLTSLTALIQVANSKLKNSDDAFLSGALAKANIQVKKMGTMINGFLNISRLESGKILIDKHIFDLTELVAETIAETELTVSLHQFRFEQQTPVMVNADRDKIGSVITNLLTNAVKYSPKNNMIEVTCKIVKKRALVSIRDEGIGIEVADHEKLFDRYYRVQNNNTQHISGFGIGLYLSAEIIHRHDGKIWVESEIGLGSTFYFDLPVAG